MKKIIIYCVLFMTYAFGVTLSPMNYTIDEKSKIKTSFQVANPTNELVAVEFKVLQLVDNPQGKEQRVPTTKIRVYPTQFILDAKASQNIRVHYIGNIPKTEEVYRVIAKELDVSITDNDDNTSTDKIHTKIKLRYSYEGLLFVRSRSAIPNLNITSFKELKSTNSSRVIELQITNSGKASDIFVPHAYDLVATINNKKYILKQSDFKDTHFHRILSGKTDIFRLSNITHLPKGEITKLEIIPKETK